MCLVRSLEDDAQYDRRRVEDEHRDKEREGKSDPQERKAKATGRERPGSR